MRLPEVICIFGVKGSGKDTAANTIEAKWPGLTKRTAFADPIKEIVLKVYPLMPREHLFGSTESREIECEAYPIQGVCFSCGLQCERLGIPGRYWSCVRCRLTFPRCLTPRLSLQSLGTEWGRRCYPNTWVELGYRTAREMSPAVITDGRFPNEYDEGLSSGACLVYLTRGLAESIVAHESEAMPRWLGEECRAGRKHFDIFLDNEYLSLEAGQAQLIRQLEDLSSRGISRIKWADK